MTALVPDWNGPCMSIVVTLGFHSPHVEVSDHTFQTRSGDAVDSTLSPYSAIGGDSRAATRVQPVASSSGAACVTGGVFSFVQPRNRITPSSRIVPTICAGNTC